MGKKYYAVKVGRIPGIYENWEDCKKQVNTYPSATFKSFATLSEAKEYIGMINVEKATSHKKKLISSKVLAYVDGSYDNSLKEFSYGMVIIIDGKENCFAQKFNNPELVEMRNVAGEIMGAKKAMQYCLEHNIKSVDIYHDYEGIAKWCMGEWKTNKIGTKAYKEFYDSVKKDLQVNFFKVKGHSGDKYNDMADKLAKDALKEK